MDKNAFEGLALLHDLVPFLPIDRLYAILNNEPLPHKAFGAALFADISGFTALMDALSQELGPERGAEELNQQINATFSGMIDAVSRYHGTVIRFSGDGLTAFFAGENAALRGAAAALAMQAFAQAIIAHYSGLRLKVGLGLGETYRFMPGEPALGVFDVLAGSAVTQMSQAEGMAQPGQIVLSPEISAAIGNAFDQEPLQDGFTILSPTIFVSENLQNRWPPLRWLDHVDRAWELVEACRPYVPPALYERASSGHGAFVADLRLVTPLFIQFTGIDFDTPQAARQLNELVRVAQGQVQQYGGYLAEVGVGDKGSEMLALFGAPVALENPAQRATYAARLLLQQLPHVEALHIGLTCEQLFTGPVGSPMRRAYAVVGDDVNLAARLMSQAGPNEVLADVRAASKANEFAWKALTPMRLKGKIAPVRVYQLIGTARSTRPLWPEGQFVAREKELTALHWALDTQADRHTRILLMMGQPGLGKSHILRKFNDLLTESGITGLHGAGRSIERQTPYHSWQDIFRGYFSLDASDSTEEWQEKVLARLHQITPDLVTHAPLLNDILHLGILENNFTRSLEPAERHTMLGNLTVALLDAWLTEDTLAVVLDNAQWMDALSWDLVTRVAQQITNRPLTLLLSMRPSKNQKQAALQHIELLPNTRILELRPLNEEDTRLLATEILGVKSIASPIATLILQKTGGNPFFIKEVVNVLQTSGIIEVVDDTAKLTGDPSTLRMPDTVQGIVRSRIDQLPPDQQTILKVAAVLGPQFQYRTLRAVQPLRLSEDALRGCLDALDSMDLHCIERTDNDAKYAFQYAITRELAYSALSFSQRRQLHSAVARWYEMEYADDIAQHYGLLVHHWRAAEVTERERVYTYLAGTRAAEQYANQDAITYLSRTLEITPEDHIDVRFDTLLRLESLYHLVADRRQQLAVLRDLTDLIGTLNNVEWMARAKIQWARYYESVAEYEAAMHVAQEAFTAAQTAQQPDLMAHSRVQEGIALMQLGRLTEARAILESTELQSNQTAIEVWRLTILGMTLSRMGLFNETQEPFRKAHKMALTYNHRAAAGQVLKSMGDNSVVMADYEKAAEYYTRSLNIRIGIGDNKGEAETLSKMGVLALLTGEREQAQTYLEQTRTLTRKTVDRASEAETLTSIGLLRYQQRDYETAQRQLAQALEIREQVGDRRGTAFAMLDLAMCEIMLANLDYAQELLDKVDAAQNNLDETSQLHTRFLRQPLAAQIKLRQGDQTSARALIDETLDTINTVGLANLPSPFQMSLIGFTVLSNLGELDRAHDLLQTAYTLLNRRADRITEPEKRARYLLTVPSHREIVGLYEQVGMT